MNKLKGCPIPRWRAFLETLTHANTTGKIAKYQYIALLTVSRP